MLTIHETVFLDHYEEIVKNEYKPSTKKITSIEEMPKKRKGKIQYPVEIISLLY